MEPVIGCIIRIGCIGGASSGLDESEVPGSGAMVSPEPPPESMFISWARAGSVATINIRTAMAASGTATQRPNRFLRTSLSTNRIIAILMDASRAALLHHEATVRMEN